MGQFLMCSGCAAWIFLSDNMTFMLKCDHMKWMSTRGNESWEVWNNWKQVEMGKGVQKWQNLVDVFYCHVTLADLCTRQ